MIMMTMTTNTTITTMGADAIITIMTSTNTYTEAAVHAAITKKRKKRN